MVLASLIRFSYGPKQGERNPNSTSFTNTIKPLFPPGSQSASLPFPTLDHNLVRLFPFGWATSDCLPGYNGGAGGSCGPMLKPPQSLPGCVLFSSRQSDCGVQVDCRKVGSAQGTQPSGWDQPSRQLHTVPDPSDLLGL